MGAGPAGSAAAYHLAKAGRSVLLLDKHQFPRPKICGDCVTPRGTRVLASMGVLPKLEGRAWPTVGCRIYSSNGGCVSAPFGAYKDYPDFGLVMSRTEFDAILVEHAIEEGAQFQPELNVTGVACEDAVVAVRWDSVTGPGEARAEYVVAADGSHSIVARHYFGYSGNDTRAVGVAFRAYFEDVDGVDDHMEICAEDPVLPGVGWLFPMGGGKANVGVGSYARDFKKSGLTKEDFLSRFVDKSPNASRKLGVARQVGPIAAARLLMGGYKGAVVKDRVVLAGDAAALINPLTGEGMMFALESGELAAEAVDAALKCDTAGPRALLTYQELVSSMYGRYFALGSRLIHLAKTPRVVNPGVALLTKSSALGRANLRFWIGMF